MNPIPLQTPDGTKIEAFMCSECKFIYYESYPHISERCCKCRDCGIKVDRFRGRCDTCDRSFYAKKEQELIEKAIEVENYTGPVFWDEKYYSSIDDFKDYVEEKDWPEFVYACHIMHYTLYADDILSDLHENAGLEEDTDLDGVEELRKAIDEFNEVNKKNVYWIVNNKVKVKVKPVYPTFEVSEK